MQTIKDLSLYTTGGIYFQLVGTLGSKQAILEAIRGRNITRSELCDYIGGEGWEDEVFKETKFIFVLEDGETEFSISAEDEGQAWIRAYAFLDGEGFAHLYDGCDMKGGL